MTAPRPLEAATLRARTRGTPLVVLLDVDGTLAPLAARPELAGVPPATLAAVQRLRDTPGVHVAVVSGRAVADARRVLGTDTVWGVGNHGAEVAEPGRDPDVHPDVGAHAAAVAAAHGELARELGALPGVLVEDKRWSLSIHTRLAARDAVPAVHAAVQRAAVAHGLRVMTGKEIFELRAPAPVHKGTAVWALVERLGGTGRDASLLFAGDDVTDEDAFRVLRERAPHALTVKVGTDAAGSAAEFSVADPAAVQLMLIELAASRA